ncbi:VPLPA-CTERM sorting domain-containing protein [Pararhodobacter sp. SW119]|uniref:VPLPA-CTERM sorting domain-containing protein n=1 Tax=Pararhodobacter sp. SW119 TaxID=2780075 RepID=UPI001ADEDB32|nr:VPLPA-CTERM sorting domain-containing protein [Pararhodobacter sp. SW119]
MKSCNNFKALAFAATALTLPITASAETALPLDGGWQFFAFSAVGAPWDDAFTFTLGAGETAWLAVTDAFLPGDQFEVFANGMSLGLTSPPASEGETVGPDADAAFADPLFSSAEAMFGEGSYRITGTLTVSPLVPGGAFLQLSSTSLGGPAFAPAPEPVAPIPLPAAGFLLIGALGGLSLLARRRLAG